MISGGYLMLKGVEFEVMMGGYFCEWLVDIKLLKLKGCLVIMMVFIYVNSLFRIIDIV